MRAILLFGGDDLLFQNTLKSMRFRIFLVFCFAFFSSNLFSEDLALLEEYKLLHIDLLNIKTSGYRSYFNLQLNRAEAKIHNFQGSFKTTKNRLFCGISGLGFFKIKLSNGLIGYTRQCELKVNKEHELTNKHYSFFDKITMPRNFDPGTLKILLNGSIAVRSSEQELVVGQLKTYKISSESLEYLKEGIYVVKANVIAEDEEVRDDKIYAGLIETSNYDLFPVLLRMYFILMTLNEKQIANVEFKRDLLRMQITKIATESNCPEKDILADTDERFIDHYENQKLFFLESILPFLKYDY
ncbi:hypothetical protein LFX17_05580 [Leptospira sp. FAT1]|nr:hypothetical protein [Leptospira sanjuanensis]